jgi:DNA polymerase I-like protein with 3'-5' exonuclease and polymerase domains
MVVADYSQQELRVMADISKDPAMIKFYVEDKSGDPDLHSHTATLVFKKPVSRNNENKHLRSKGKGVNFTVSYGGGAAKLAKTFGISIKEGKELIASFFNAYRGLKIFFDLKENETLNNGYVTIDYITNRICHIEEFDTYLWCKDYIVKQGLAGRTVHPKIWATYNKIKGKIRRLSQNYPIQGTSGSMTKLAAVFLRD